MGMLLAINVPSKSEHVIFQQTAFFVFETFRQGSLDKLGFEKLLVAFLLWQEGYTQ